MNIDFLRDTRNWHRKGGGHGVDFFASNMEIFRFLKEGILAELKPFYVVGKEFDKPFFKYNFDDFLDCMKNHSDSWSFFIYSSKLTPFLLFDSVESFSSICALNGFINIQNSRQDRGKICETSISIVNQVENIKTWEVRSYEEYYKIFKRTKRIVKKNLKYTSILTYKNGMVAEDTSLQMTEGAAELIRQGYPFRAQVGNLVNKKSKNK